MNVADGMWYSILIVSEVSIIPYRVGNDIVEGGQISIIKNINQIRNLRVILLKTFALP